VGVVGCEETMPSLGNNKLLAKAMAIPYFPIAVPVPLPAKVYLNFGKPMWFKGDIDDEESLKEKVEVVKDEIRALMDKGLKLQGGRVF
jgi:hypothetical protein